MPQHCFNCVEFMDLNSNCSLNSNSLFELVECRKRKGIEGSPASRPTSLSLSPAQNPLPLFPLSSRVGQTRGPAPSLSLFPRVGHDPGPFPPQPRAPFSLPLAATPGPPVGASPSPSSQRPIPPLLCFSPRRSGRPAADRGPPRRTLELPFPRSQGPTGRRPSLLSLLEARRAWVGSTRIEFAGGAEAVARTTRTPRPLRPFLSPAVLSRFLSASAASLSSPLCPSATVPQLGPRTAPPSTEPRAAAIPPLRRQSLTAGRRRSFQAW
jgi:hypothetical protein